MKLCGRMLHAIILISWITRGRCIGWKVDHLNFRPWGPLYLLAKWIPYCLLSEEQNKALQKLNKFLYSVCSGALTQNATRPTGPPSATQSPQALSDINFMAWITILHFLTCVDNNARRIKKAGCLNLRSHDKADKPHPQAN
jgi:hypothetical protein